MKNETKTEVQKLILGLDAREEQRQFGTSRKKKENFPIDAISKRINFGNYQIDFSRKTPTSLKGKIILRCEASTDHGSFLGEFLLDLKNSEYTTNLQNVGDYTFSKLKLELVLNPKMVTISEKNESNPDFTENNIEAYEHNPDFTENKRKDIKRVLEFSLWTLAAIVSVAALGWKAFIFPVGLF
jgi:hypothetical protein